MAGETTVLNKKAIRTLAALVKGRKEAVRGFQEVSEEDGVDTARHSAGLERVIDEVVKKLRERQTLTQEQFVFLCDEAVTAVVEAQPFFKEVEDGLRHVARSNTQVLFEVAAQEAQKQRGR